MLIIDVHTAGHISITASFGAVALAAVHSITSSARASSVGVPITLGNMREPQKRA
jgi:hypothetical protein